MYGTVDSRREFIESHPVIGASFFAAPIAACGFVVLLLMGLSLPQALVVAGLASLAGALPAWWMLRSTPTRADHLDT
jgi:hypothetical protein